MKLYKEYTIKVAIFMICFVTLLEFCICIFIYKTSIKIFETTTSETLERTKRKTTELTESINKYISNLLMNYITKLKLISKHTLLFNGKINSDEKSSINKNSKIFLNKNLGKRILKAETEEIYNIEAFKKIFNNETQRFDYNKYYLENLLKKNNNHEILKQFIKEHDELNYISYQNISGQTNLNNLDEDTTKKLIYMIPIFKTIFIQRFISKKTLMDITRILIINEKELIIYPPEDSGKISLINFYKLYPESNCSYHLLTGGNYFACVFYFIYNNIFPGYALERFIMEEIEYQQIIGLICMKISFIKNNPKGSILCIEVDFEVIVKSIPFHIAKYINFGFFNPMILDLDIQMGDNKYHLYLQDIYIIENSAREAYVELHELYNSTKTTPYNYVIDDKDPMKILKYYSLFHFIYFDLTKIIKEHPDLNINITKIEDEYESLKKKIFTKFKKSPIIILQFNKTTCRKRILRNNYECFTDEAEIDIIPLSLKLNVLNEDLVHTDEISIADHNCFIYSIIYTNPETNRKDIKLFLRIKLIRIIIFFIFMTLISIAFFILFINILSNYSLSNIDNIIKYMKEIVFDDEKRKINILKENKSWKQNEEMMNLNDIYDLIRKSLIIKESFGDEFFMKKHRDELFDIVQKIKDKTIKEICNSFIGIYQYKNNLYFLSEKQIGETITNIKEKLKKLTIVEQYDKIKDTIKRSSRVTYLNEYSNFENVDENMLKIINLNIYKQRYTYLYAMNKFKLGSEIVINKNKKNKEKREKYFNDAIKYFKDNIDINKLLGINQIKIIFSLIMQSKCYLYLNNYKNSIITINNALHHYINFSKTFNNYQIKNYIPRILLFIETNIFYHILYAYSKICSYFNKSCASNFILLKIFETSPFILKNIHHDAGVMLLNFLEKNKSKMNKYDKDFYKNPIMLNEYEKFKNRFIKTVSRLYIKNMNEKNRNLNSNKITGTKNNNSNHLKQTNADNSIVKTRISSNIKGELITSKLSLIQPYKEINKNITICLNEKILGNIYGQKLKNIIIKYLNKYFIENENDKFSFIQFSSNGRKTLCLQSYSLKEFIIKMHKIEYAFESNAEINLKTKTCPFNGLYDIFDIIIKNCRKNELNDNIAFLFMNSEDIRFSSVVDCLNIVEELNKNKVSIYFICFDDIINEIKINNIQSFLNGLTEGYLFHIKNYIQLKEIFVYISNAHYQSNFFKFEYKCFEHYL